MGYNVCLALFDLRKGPYVAYNRNLEEGIASRVALKSMIALGSMDDWNTDQESEAIISIPENKIISFFRIFPILNVTGKDIRASDGDKYLPASLIFVTDMSNQMQLYQDAPKLSRISKNFAKQLKKVVKQTGDIKEGDLTKLVTNYLSEELINSVLEKELDASTEEVTKETEAVEPKLNLWKRYLDEGLDKIVRNLIIGKHVVFILKDQRQAPMQIAIANLFNPHLDIKTKMWASSYDEEYKIQCGPPELKDSLPDSVVLFDQIQHQITGGENNEYCKEIVTKTIDFDTERTEQYLLSELNDILSEIGILIAEITTTLDISDNKEAMSRFKQVIDGFKQQKSSDELDLIEGLMNRTNAEILDRIKQKYLLDSTRVQVLQEVIIDMIGPAGKIVTKRIIKGKLKKTEYELGVNDIEPFTDELIGTIEEKDILTEQEIQTLQNRIYTELEDFRSLLQKTSIFD